jgi:hypothetical protein
VGQVVEHLPSKCKALSSNAHFALVIFELGSQDFAQASLDCYPECLSAVQHDAKKERRIYQTKVPRMGIKHLV